MNILVVGKFYAEGFALHIAETLEATGHAVRRFEPGFKQQRMKGRIGHRLDQVFGVLQLAAESLPTVRAHRMRALWHEVSYGTIDVVLVCHDFLWAEEVSELKRRTGALVAMWFPDSLVNFGKGHFMNAPYDGLFFKDPYIVHVLSGRLSSPVYYLPECFNPIRHRLPEGEGIGAEYRCDLTTAGNAHSWRVAFYNRLAEYDVKMWGNPFPLWMPAGRVNAMHQGRPVLNEEKARAFLGAKIVLNNLLYGEIWGVNARTFEAAGIGAFQMLDWRPGLSQLFADGKELVSFRCPEDLYKKLEYWLLHDEERLTVAQAGKNRAHSEHTYALRLSLLLDTLAGGAGGFPLPKIEPWQ